MCLGIGLKFIPGMPVEFLQASIQDWVQCYLLRVSAILSVGVKQYEVRYVGLFLFYYERANLRCLFVGKLFVWGLSFSSMVFSAASLCRLFRFTHGLLSRQQAVFVFFLSFFPPLVGGLARRQMPTWRRSRYSLRVRADGSPIPSSDFVSCQPRPQMPDACPE